MANLIVLNGFRRGTVLPVGDPLVIGRESDADLRLPDFLVSARHAAVLPDAEGFRLQDLSSTNGTFRNGARVLGTETLSPGDVIQLGTTEVLFTEEDHLDDSGDEGSSVQEALVDADDDDYAVRMISDTAEELLLEEAPGDLRAEPTVSVVHAVQRSFSLAWDLDDLLQRVADQFVRATAGVGVVVVLQRDGRPEVVYRGRGAGKRVYRAEEVDFAVREDLLERALRERGMLLARSGPDGAATSVLRKGMSAGEPLGAGLSLCLSLPAPVGIVGAVYVHDVHATLAREDLRLLSLVASLAGVHCRSYLLVEQLRDRNVRLESTNRELEGARQQLAEMNEELRGTVEARTAELGEADSRMRLLSRIVANVQEAVVSTTLEGVVTSWNPGAEALYGYAGDDVVGEVLPTVPDARSTEFERVLRAVAAGRSLALRSERVGQDDRVIPVHVTFAPVTQADGQPVGLVEIARDLREQLRLEERMRWQERLASFGELATGLAHELGNPLANLRSGVEYLLARPRGEEAVRESLSVLHQEIVRLHRLVTQALDLGRWRPPDLEPIAGRALLDYVADAVAQLAAALGVEIARPAPPRDAELLLAGDADQLKQALLNLVANAMDAMPQGGRLELDVCEEDGLVGLVVGDSGAGITPEDQERMFELFFSRRAGGSGIGLAIVKRIVDLHAGRVLVESEPGRGTTLTLFLPRWSEDAAAEEGR